LQQNFLELKSASGTLVPLMTFIEELKIVVPKAEVPDTFDTAYEGFEARIAVRNVSFTYPGNDVKALTDISFDIEANSTYAIVGPSGSGKSTLVDILLGILPPDHGEVEISGVPPSKAIETWAGAIAYVPQDIVIINNTVAKNISMGYPNSQMNRGVIQAILEKTQLSEFISSLSAGIDSLVGDRGSKLSGGQRQRLGLARALFTYPKLLFLDEATSALDSNTEELVATSILKSSNMTVITIAHRPATIKKADFIIYLDSGVIRAIGTLEDGRKKVPDFDNQIELMRI
jgi:ABC-type multidrug transport system fused ATPase/permease subunit